MHQLAQRTDRSTPSPTFLRRGLLSALAVALTVAGATLGLSVGSGATESAAATTSYSIWPDTMTPRTPADPDTDSVELGLRFTVADDGLVTAIRF